MEDIDREYQLALNLHMIIVPKLQAISNSGNAATIHEANQLLGIILHAKRYADYFYTEENILKYKTHLQSAEKWLLELVKGIGE